MKLDLKDLTLAQLTDFIKSMGEPEFRARQIFSWLYRPEIRSFTQMTDIAKEFRVRLAEIALISRLQLKAREESEDGTVKYAFTLADGNIIESVLIPEGERHTLCVSSQAGCAMACKFCLTGAMGLKRNLLPSEIVNQVQYIRDELAADEKGRLNNLVFMGMGEPLANFDNLITAINILLDQRGLNFSDRRVTVSTCGLVPQIIKLGQQSSVNLAISLHTADNATRDQLMPVNKTYPLDDLLEACRHYPLPKRRRIMIEYVLIKGINDSLKDARQLVTKLHGIPCKINLLPFNQCPTLPYRRPSKKVVKEFQQILHDAGYTVIIRQSRGADISAACGQLADN